LNLQNFILFNAEPQQIKYVNGIAFISGQIRAFGPVIISLSKLMRQRKEAAIFMFPYPQRWMYALLILSILKNLKTLYKSRKLNVQILMLLVLIFPSVFSLTPQAKIRVSLPQDAGTIEGSGEGVMTVEVNSQGDLNITGQYEIQSGSFLFNLQNILSRMLEIEKGSNIRFSGDPLNAEIDLKASFTTRTTLSGLGLDLDSTITSARIPVKTIIRLQNKLLNPQIPLAFNFPK
jgi:hypothetical protein